MRDTARINAFLQEKRKKNRTAGTRTPPHQTDKHYQGQKAEQESARSDARGAAAGQHAGGDARREERAGGGFARKSHAQQRGQAARPGPRPSPSAEEAGQPDGRANQRPPTATALSRGGATTAGRQEGRRAGMKRGTTRGAGTHRHAQHRDQKKGTRANPPTKPSGVPPPREKPQDSAASWAPHPTRLSLCTRMGVPQAHAMAVGVREKTYNGTATKRSTQPATECFPERGPSPLPLRPHAPLTAPPWPPAPRTRAACATGSRPAAPSAPPFP